ncbi:hypothetical protein [Oceanihabitans sediminis]|uniref:hypothetical protein n=1 Tax=Oceanihabitans sediminis TaxID=1812012 RepID=UPI00299F11DF|nr:hypothetical protein [Oceanihabitans sediminis]MDX1279241.1 hypothetical protein [Oceanihabitans sediminis]
MRTKFPKIIHSRTYGPDCGDGWFELISNLCRCIQIYIDNNQHNNVKQVYATQIKEKFGGLRFYTNYSEEYIKGMIWFAEYLSYTICEKCGNPGKLSDTHWVRTLCEDCKNESG